MVFLNCLSRQSKETRNVPRLEKRSHTKERTCALPPPVHARQELRGLHASTLFVLLPWTLEHNLCLSRSAHLLSNGLAAGPSGSSWLPGASGHKRSL